MLAISIKALTWILPVVLCCFLWISPLESLDDVGSNERIDNSHFGILMTGCAYGPIIAWGSQNVLVSLTGDSQFCKDHVIRTSLFTQDAAHYRLFG